MMTCTRNYPIIKFIIKLSLLYLVMVLICSNGTERVRKKRGLIPDFLIC